MRIQHSMRLTALSALIAIVSVGCGRFGFDPEAAVDAAPDAPLADDRLDPADPLGACAANAPVGSTYVVSPTGDDDGDGTSDSPWRTISFASNAADDGSTILVRAGTYNEEVRLTRQLASGITIRSEGIYQARIESTNSAIICIDCSRFTVVGFDLTQTPAATFPIVLVTGPDSHRFTLRNNIVHDSTDNAGVRLSGEAQNAIVEYNIIYNIARGAQIHIAAGSGSTVRHNLLFSSYAPIPDTRYFGGIWVETTEQLSSEHLISGNILFGWQSEANNSAMFFDRAQSITAENNLIVGDTDEPMRSSFELNGASEIIVRNNTVTGNLRADGYALWLRHPSDDELVEAEFSNNIWSDSSGGMNDFSNSPAASITSVILESNIVWNGVNAVPSDPNDEVNASDDNNGRILDPLLPAITPFTRPVWIPEEGEFAGGHENICEVFGALVTQFGQIGPTSPAATTAGNAEAPTTDILGEPRQIVSVGARQPE